MTTIDVGINYPWGEYGWDFGVPPWGTRKPWASALTSDLQLFRQLRIFCVRWFILGDGFTYGSGSGIAPYPDPNPRRSGQWRFDDPPRLTNAFLQDFTSLLDEFRRSRIKLLPSLIDFHFCYPGVDKDNQGRPLPSGFIKCGRSDVIVDPSKRNKFFDRVLEPLLSISRRYRDIVYAWELINEPEWVTLGLRLEGATYRPTVPLGKMLEFIREGIGRINASRFRSSVGYASYARISEWEERSQKEFGKSLGITLHQFHYYPYKEKYLRVFKRRPKIPLHVFDPRWPCFIGEFASSALSQPWPELRSQDIYSQLKLIERKGFPSAFIWSAHGTDEHTDWTPQVQQMVRRYTSGR